MSRQVLDMSNDKLEELFSKTNGNFEEVYQKGTELDQKNVSQDAEIASKATKAEHNTLKSRVDLLTQTPSEETEGNAELIDIRVGADGKTYPTAGDAVRSQISSQILDSSYAYLFGDGYIDIDTVSRTLEVKVASGNFLYITSRLGDTKNYYRLANSGIINYQPDDYYPKFIMMIYADVTGYSQDTENPKYAELKVDLPSKFREIYDGNQLVIGFIYRNSISSVNSYYLRVNGKYLVSSSDTALFVPNTMKILQIVNGGTNSLEFIYESKEDTNSYTIKMSADRIYGYYRGSCNIVNGAKYPEVAPSGGTVVFPGGSISAEYPKSSMVFSFCVADMSDSTIKIKQIHELSPNDYIICSFYQSNFNAYENSYLFKKKNGDRSVYNILSTTHTFGSTLQKIAVPYSGKIVLSSTGFKLTVSNLNLYHGIGTWSADGASLEVDWSAETNPTYSRYLMYNSSTKKLQLMTNLELRNLFSSSSNQVSLSYWYLVAIIYNRKYGYTASAQKGFYYIGDKDIYDDTQAASNYDYPNFRFIMPRDLYLIKNLPTTVITQNICLPQFSDQDKLKFEMALPSNISQGEEILNINIPFEHSNPYHTRIAVKHSDYSYMFSKDIDLHVVDIADLVSKDCKVLNIGDSITESMLPSCLNWMMKSLGLNPTFIGTRNNNNKGYGYGILDDLEICKGEGRGGWRLTDFACRTQKKDKTRYINSSFEMMNPDTQNFDFSYYMQNQSFDGVDFVTIQLGTNDISGYHYAGSVSTNSDYQQIYSPTLDEYLNPESEFYIINLYKLIVDSILQYDSNIKIAISAPMVNTFNTSNAKYLQWAEVLYNYFEGNPDYPNVYCIACGMWQGNMSVHALVGVDKTPVSDLNDTYKVTNNNVHVNGMGEFMQALPMAAWIANMLK